MADLILLEAGLLSIEFCRATDRYAHQVFIGHGGERRLLLESIEGGGGEPWPPSPPLQELHVERQTDGRQVALLVGRAGRSHWSLSVEPSESRLLMDAACRISGPAEWLGSTYRGLAGITVAEGGANLAVGCGLRLEWAETDQTALTADGNALRIHATGLAATGPRTVRWRYVIESSC